MFNFEKVKKDSTNLGIFDYNKTWNIWKQRVNNDVTTNKSEGIFQLYTFNDSYLHRKSNSWKLLKVIKNDWK